MDTVFFDINVQGVPEINNVFTPNSDGINDEFSHIIGGHDFQRKKFSLDAKPSLKFIE